MQTKFGGNIETIRAVEDCVRASKRYTEGITTIRRQHPVQGEEFASKAFSKYYEVYPETEISWNMPANTALDWLFSDTPRINMVFFYDYRNNSANVRISDGDGAVKALVRNISGIRDALDKATEVNGRNHPAEQRPVEPHVHIQPAPVQRVSK